MLKRVGVSLILLFMVSSSLALGAGDSEITTINWTVLPFATLSIAGEGEGEAISTTVALPQPTAADLERGYVELERALTLIAVSNTNWRLTVRSPNSNLGRSYDGAYVKPLSDFQLRARGGEYCSITNEDRLLTSGTQGRYELEIDYRILFHPGYRPGDYRVTLIYTITTD
jgi:hypothetical protein